jgi:chromosomal replication initiator protein
VEHAVEPTAEAVWQDLSSRLRETLNETTYSTWFSDAGPGELLQDSFSVVVPNDFTREWVEGHFLGFMSAAVCDALGQDMRVRVVVSDHPVAPPQPAADITHGSSKSEQEPGTQPGANPKYTFDNFVIGSSNRFAHAAALAVAEAPAQAYNPLFIYGGTGLGKTHLLQAIGAYVSEHTRRLTTRYVTSETFMNDFINSLRDKRIEGFKQRYRTYDVLLVDDIQFFEGKERIQEEFFHTFNSLYEAGRQIVISSDVPSRTCFRAIRSCAVTMSRGAAAGIRTACRSRSKWRSSWVLPISSRSKNSASINSMSFAGSRCSLTFRIGSA